MKKTIFAFALLAGFSGAAFAERPTESSDRVDYNLSGSYLTGSVGSENTPFSTSTVTIEESSEARRLDEKNEPTN